MSYVGGPGYEIHVPTDQCATLYDALSGAGAAFGLRDAGYYTLDALRIEAGRRAWGADLSPDETPLEAGLSYAVALEQAGRFHRPRRAAAPDASAASTKRLVQLTLDDPAAFPWGGEPVLMDDRYVGELTSAGYSRTLGRAVAFVYARARPTPTTPLTDADRSTTARYADRHRRHAASARPSHRETIRTMTAAASRHAARAPRPHAVAARHRRPRRCRA